MTNPPTAEIVKALRFGFTEEAVYAAADRLEALEAELAKVKARAMPCEMGETLWRVFRKRDAHGRLKPMHVMKTTLSWRNVEMVMLEYGHTVFTTREEAEAEFEKEKAEYELLQDD